MPYVAWRKPLKGSSRIFILIIVMPATSAWRRRDDPAYPDYNAIEGHYFQACASSHQKPEQFFSGRLHFPVECIRALPSLHLPTLPDGQPDMNSGADSEAHAFE